MISNKTGRDVKKPPEGMPGKIFGLMKHSRSQYSEIPIKTRLVKISHSNDRAKKFLLETEFKKNRAIEFVRRLQNR